MAANTIKGLTVEIGGDTTKLGKALEGVNKKSRDLSTELGQINKLLKLDPKNTTLLAQKQKVLAEAIDNTSSKLDKLKEAEKQVQKQFKRGEVSEEQVRALQREIVDTERKLDSYKKAVKETGKATKDLGDDSEKTEGKLGKLGKAASTGLKALGAAVAAAGAALIASAEASREYRTEMGKLSTAFETAGHSTETAKETYKSLQGVLGETDQAVEAANHLAKLADNEKDLQKWTDICTGVYATFGASLPIEGLTEAANETAKVGQVTGPLADALNWAGVNEDKFNESLADCSNEQERQTLIMETLNGLYDDAADKYKETNAEVIRANQANEEWASVTAEVGAAVEPLLTDVKLLGASLVKDLVPGVKEVTGALRAMLNGDEGAAANLGEALSGIFSNLLNKITELIPAVAEMGTSLITTLISSIIQSLPNLLNTGVQAVLAIVQGIASAIPQIIAALTGAIPLITQTIVEAIPQIVQTITNVLTMSIPQLVQGAVQFLMAIVDAIPQIIPPLIEAIPTLVQAVIDGLLTSIPLLLDGALQLLMAIVDAIPLIIPQLIEAIPQIVTTIVNGLIEAIPQLVEGAVQFLMALVDAIPIIIQAIIPQIPMIVTTVVNELLRMVPTLLAGAVKLFMALVQAIPKIVVALVKNLPQILQAIVSVLGAIPTLIMGILGKVITGIGKWGLELASKAGRAALDLVKTVVNTVKELPKKFLSLGKDLAEGLWKGLKNSLSWLKKKIKGWVGDVTKFLKKLFGINSPSKVTAYMGEMLDEGLAVGIEGNEGSPKRAMKRLSNNMLGEAERLNGITFGRRLRNTFEPSVASVPGETGMLDKLDQILGAIQKGQVLTINGDKLVGATAGSMNSALGQRRILTERGAI